jgi:hypothetical protein
MIEEPRVRENIDWDLYEHAYAGLPYGFSSINESLVKSPRDGRIFKTLKSIHLNPCTESQRRGLSPLEDELLKCNQSLLVEDYERIDPIYVKLKLVEREGQNVYKVQDPLSRVDVMGYDIRDLSWDVTGIIESRVRAFTASGTNTFLLQLRKETTRRELVTELRNGRNINLEGLSYLPSALSFNTRVRIVFFVYLICVLADMLCFIIEMRHKLAELMRQAVRKIRGRIRTLIRSACNNIRKCCVYMGAP